MTSIVSRSNNIAKHARRARRSSSPRLNLVSLMDIFTILVFFLMLNTGEVEVLQPDERVALPKSFATLRPDESPVIKVNNDTLYFREEALASVAGLQGEEDELIRPLLAKLEAFQQDRTTKDKRRELPDNSIAIMGDESLPYSILKKVLYTCAQAGFRDVALAVEHSTRASTTAPTTAYGAAS